MSNEAETMKESKGTLTPKLRFPAFRDRPYHDVRLGEVAEDATERNNGTLDADVVMGVFKDQGMLPMEQRLVARDVSRYKIVKKDYFAYNPMRLNIGSIARWAGDKPVLVSPDYVVFRCLDDSDQNLDPNYLDQFRYSDQWDRFVSLAGDGSVRVRIYFRDLAALRLILPPTNQEQQKIAECLSSLDAVIAAEGRMLEALKAHKKGLMQQLFPQPGQTQPRLRFPEFQDKGEWEERKLEKLAKRGSGHTPKKSNPEYYNGGIKWVSLADSKGLDSGLISDTENEISDQGLKNSSAVLHPAGTVLISRDAGVGKSAIMAVPMAVSQHFIIWTCNRLLLSNWFLYHLFQNMKPRFERIATGSTIKTIGLQYFKDLCVTIPSPDEQQKIADCLTALDTQIEAQTAKIDALKTHKRGLMQQIFPAPKEIEA